MTSLDVGLPPFARSVSLGTNGGSGPDRGSTSGSGLGTGSRSRSVRPERGRGNGVTEADVEGR